MLFSFLPTSELDNPFLPYEMMEKSGKGEKEAGELSEQRELVIWMDGLMK